MIVKLRHNCLKLVVSTALPYIQASKLQTGCRMTASTISTLTRQIPRDVDDVDLRVGKRVVRLTHLRKLFWRSRGITKGDLLRYYLAISPALLPHLRNRAMVMKRYPNGASGGCFFMKRAPTPRPDWIETCAIEHGSGSVIDFPTVQDVASLLWVVNLGCIDLNQWYARCDDVDRPDYLHFDLDPAKGASFARVLQVALLVRDALHELRMPAFVKTSGATGVHVYVPIVRGPLQKQVWTFAKELARTIAAANPKIATAEYIIAKRPYGRVFVDYNQNAWGKTLASVYSVRPTPRATVSTPVTWDDVERGIDRDEFRMDTVPERVVELGDLWAPMLAARGRVRLEKFL
jgi:bifunctional non-homologous end joining protein LigD